MGFFLIFSYPQFLSTPSVGRATAIQGAFGTIAEISIHALRGEGDSFPACSTMLSTISIHALRGEGDHAKIRFCGWCQHFYPRPPRGGRPTDDAATVAEVTFLSTPSVGRATNTGQRRLQRDDISIHALRGEGDRDVVTFVFLCLQFLSTPSVGRATLPIRPRM